MTTVGPRDHARATFLRPLPRPVSTALWAWLRAWAFQIVFCTGLLVWSALGIVVATWLLHTALGALVGS